MNLRRLLLGSLALGLVGVMACGGSRWDDGYSDVSSYDVGSDQGYPDAGVDSSVDVNDSDTGVDSSVDVNDSDTGSEELKAIACPDVQEEVGGPYRINDANDEHDGWCLYTVRVYDFFRFDGCRSTGDIDEYYFGHFDRTTICGNVQCDQCWCNGFAFGSIGEYEGRLLIFTEDRKEKDEDPVLFKVLD